ncbi:MAG TPA: Rieske 2Fe-2S domain-containing protein [Stellaceae bacterium]|nr:Rieske 2Fe-2S domain-containing protein [Stellaceae bacterium]
MLSKEDNQLLSQVGAGTPMGDFMRKFWVPAMRTEALEAGGDPIKLRLLGEDMVAFRGHDGRVGVLDERCPHRGVSLTLARNADCALTCIFHGWKMDADGNVVDVPAEPPERREAFAKRVKAKHYPAEERAGVLWVWMGGGIPAPLPNFPWMNLPAEHVGSRIGVIHANWVNGLEGQLDSAHVGILHQDWVQVLPGQVSDLQRTQFDLAPRFEFEETSCGYREGAVRNSKEGGLYVRVREFVAPWYSFIPSMGGLDSGHLCTMSIPMDDEHSIQWDLFYSPVSPLVRRNSPDDGRNQNDLAENMGNIDNRWGQNRERMRSNASFSGYPILRHEDYAVAMAQGIWAARDKEQLSSSDIPIVRGRRFLVNAARDKAVGDKVAAAMATELSHVRAFSEVIGKDAKWQDLPLYGPEHYAGFKQAAE